MHLLVDISAHGYGHLAQAAPVLDALRVRRPGLRLTLRSGLPGAVLEQRIVGDFAHIAEAKDFGFAMLNAVDIDRAASEARYRDFHADWAARVEAEASALRALGVDAVLSNAAYLPLAAARCAGLPGVGLCSLNWVDLFRHYFGAEHWAAPIAAQMLAAYRDALAFLRVTPGMPMADFAHRVDIGPIARIGTPARRDGDGVRRVLVAMGGMEFRLPVENWPRRSGLRWLLPAEWGVARDDVEGVAVQGQAFTDLLASVDAVVTKPGYGTFAEAGCNGVPLLYLERDDWLETPHLAGWLATHGRVRRVGRAALLAGDILADLDALWAAPAPPPPAPTGAAEAVDWLDRHLP